MSSVAVIGLNGLLGKSVITSLISEPFISKLSAPIKLLTTSGKQPVEPSDQIEYIKYQSGDGSLSKALAGVDVVINLAAIPGPQEDILKALKENNVKLYIPSQFGIDISAVNVDFPGFLSAKTSHSMAARALSVKVIDVITGLFIKDDQTFTFSPFPVVQFDAEKKEIEIVGDKKEETPVNPSFFRDIGNAVASIVSRPDYTSLPDTIRIFSDKVSLGDYIKFNEKRNNVKLTKTYKDTTELVAEAKDKYKEFSFKDFGFYLRVFTAQGEGKGITFEVNNQRELINPNESLFEWTRFQK